MYFEPGITPHNLPYDPFKSCVIPRPIGWISTLDREGNHNLAPYSQFQNVTFDPPIVMFCANQDTKGERKDSVRNAENTDEFVWNMATYDLRHGVNISAEELPPHIDEFERAGLLKLPSTKVKPMRVAGSPIQFECVYMNTMRFPGNSPMGTVDVVFGHVVAVHIDDAYIKHNGMLDVLKMKPLARLGYYDYTYIENIFEMIIPGGNAKLAAGLEGSAKKINQ
jgi:flavin reductase (DIM6/NTAB) family NADH-FMN oxidoreductase RutF